MISKYFPKHWKSLSSFNSPYHEMETSIKTRFRKENKTWKKVKNFFPPKKITFTHTQSHKLSQKVEKWWTHNNNKKKKKKNCAE